MFVLLYVRSVLLFVPLLYCELLLEVPLLLPLPLPLAPLRLPLLTTLNCEPLAVLTDLFVLYVLGLGVVILPCVLVVRAKKLGENDFETMFLFDIGGRFELLKIFELFELFGLF